jgi:heptosyltransferase-2
MGEPESDRLLVVAPSWIGDTVLAQSLFITLKARSPAPRVEVLAPPWSLPLLARMPQVDEAIAAPLAHGRLRPRARLGLARTLRARHYAQAIVLPNSWKSALVPFLAGIPLRTGWLGEQRYGLLNDWRRLDRRALPRTVEQFAALGLPAGHPPPPELPRPALRASAPDVSAALGALGLRRPDGPLLALCPGAEYGPAKRWPAEYFGALAHAWIARGGTAWLFGSSADAPVCALVNESAGRACGDLSGRTTLTQAIDLLSLADAVVTNDSGLMHVAAALDRRVIALYGSSDPGMTPPMSKQATVLRTGIECSPCFKRECPLGHFRCMRELEPARVLDALAIGIES